MLFNSHSSAAGASVCSTFFAVGNRESCLGVTLIHCSIPTLTTLNVAAHTCKRYLDEPEPGRRAHRDCQFRSLVLHLNSYIVVRSQLARVAQWQLPATVTLY